jgi:hypothetical protein
VLEYAAEAKSSTSATHAEETTRRVQTATVISLERQRWTVVNALEETLAFLTPLEETAKETALEPREKTHRVHVAIHKRETNAESVSEETLV